MSKKFLIILFILLTITSFSFGQSQHIESRFTENISHVYYLFNGQWLPDLEPELIGPTNYKSLVNLRYTDNAIEGTNGYTKINTSVINSEYYKFRSGIHFKKDYPDESHVLWQAYNYDGTQSRVYENKTTIPNQGDFEATHIHADESYGTFTGTYGHQLSFTTEFLNSGVTHAIGVGSLMGTGVTHAIFSEAISVAAVITHNTPRGRFTKGPGGTVVYCNGAESQVWGGNESRVAAFIVSDAEVTEFTTNPRDYTEQINNEYETSDNVANVSGSTAYFLVGSPRPLSGISFYVSTTNAISGQTIEIAEWNGTTWQDLTETDGTTGFSLSSGRVSFSSTVNTSKPKYLEGRLLYWYQGQLTSGGASIYNVTLEIPWQDIKDLWDGVWRVPIAFQASRSNEYEDWTLEVNQNSSDLYPIGADVGGLKSSDHILIAFQDRAQAIYLQLLSGNTNPFGPDTTISYWNGYNYTASSVTWDGTGDVSGITPLGQSGVLTWQPPDYEDEFPQYNFGVRGYFYKIEYGGTLGGTDPSDDMVIIDRVYGVPAPLKLNNYKFATFYKNRVFLCGYLKGNQANRIDYSKANTPDCWNGEETSHNTLYGGPKYAGGSEELIAAIQIYNRYGAELYNNLLLFKRNETYILFGNGPESFDINTISENIGCPAPFTLTSAEVGYEMVSNEIQRNVVMWLSSTGPCIFDGAVLMPIRGIDNYFDPNDSDYVGMDNIEDAFAWYDPNFKEWNLRVENYWFAYDFLRKKWYRRDVGTAQLPTYAFQVSDTDGAKYVFAGMDDGYMRRLENGYTWDGTAISQEVETGDFFLDNDAWYQTLLRRIKLSSKIISESATVQVTHYADTNATGTSVFSIALNSGSNLTQRKSKPLPNLTNWLHRLKFSTETSNTNKGWKPLGWGYEYRTVREDHNN